MWLAVWTRSHKGQERSPCLSCGVVCCGPGLLQATRVRAEEKGTACRSSVSLAARQKAAARDLGLALCLSYEGKPAVLFQMLGLQKALISECVCKGTVVAELMLGVYPAGSFWCVLHPGFIWRLRHTCGHLCQLPNSRDGAHSQQLGEHRRRSWGRGGFPLNSGSQKSDALHISNEHGK